MMHDISSSRIYGVRYLPSGFEEKQGPEARMENGEWSSPDAD